MSFVTIQKNTRCVGTAAHLPASKSISNRVLILDALAGGGSSLRFLSDANDTQLMRRLLASSNPMLDAEDAGTTMRFLTAYFALQPGTRTLTGTERMQQRPIGILTDALEKLGAGIRFVTKQGFPPTEITGITAQKTASISIRGDISSQYISALMMIAPVLPMGLNITFEGHVASRPYLEMTASLMREFGAELDLSDKGVQIIPRPYRTATIVVEPDWSAASYWFAYAALAEEARILLPRVSLKSLQGDRAIVETMFFLGVNVKEAPEGLQISGGHAGTQISGDFRQCPDLAQTVIVVCAAKNIPGRFTGLESLRIKETDRISALQAELAKTGARFFEDHGAWVLEPSSRLPASVTINTYEDHRMAMAFAPLSAKMEVTIENSLVVRKSYPGFWEDVKSLGYSVNESTGP